MRNADAELVGSFSVDNDRLAGYVSELAKVGVSVDDVPIVECAADFVTNAAKGARLLFDRAPEVTAVLAMTDVQALAVIEEARRRGIGVPGDLSVVGFDDIPEARTCTPPLTTVVHPIVEKGRAAARLLFEDGPIRHIRLPVTLAVRGSTAPPRERIPAARSSRGTRGKKHERR